MNILESIDNLLYESDMKSVLLKGSPRETHDELLKFLFPKSYKTISLKYFFDPTVADKYPIVKKDVSYFYEKSSGLKVEIRRLNDTTPNAVTIPGIDDISKFSKSNNPALYAYESLKALKDKKLSATYSNGKIKFDVPKNFKILMYQTTGLEKLLPNKNQRLAVHLHEIGHWMKAEPLIPANIAYFAAAITSIPEKIGLIGTFGSILTHNDPGFFRILWLSSLAIVMITTIIANYYSRIGEREADQFVKDIKQGKHLADSLSMLSYKKSVKGSNKERKAEADSLGSQIIKTLSIPFSSHPNTNDRIDDLLSKEGIGDLPVDFFNTILPAVKKMLESLDSSIASS
jgi:Zn-dependent protease with chaperone function